MDSLLNVSRRGLVKWGLAAAGLPALTRALGSSAFAQDAGSEGGKKGAVGGRADGELFTGNGLPGGGQLEIRLTQTMYTSDPDALEVAQRMKPFDLDSWITEWTRVAEKNEQMAEKFVADGFKVTANEYYLRAAGFERVQINYEGKMLDGYFRKPNNPPGKKFPAVIAFQGADTMAEATIMGGGAYAARGMAYLAVDFPGQGGALRLKDLHLPPDTERVAKAMIDYLETRPDVDATRVGMQGISMGGYGVPRAASGEKRIKAAFMSSGSYDLKADLFEYYPPIQERVRWIIGAKDLADARKQLAEYNLNGKANKIEAPMLIGYSKDDRIMDPAGALRLYEAAVNSKRDMVEGTGHVQAANAGGPRERRPVVFPDWAAKTLGADS